MAITSPSISILYRVLPEAYHSLVNQLSADLSAAQALYKAECLRMGSNEKSRDAANAVFGMMFVDRKYLINREDEPILIEIKALDITATDGLAMVLGPAKEQRVPGFINFKIEDEMNIFSKGNKTFMIPKQEIKSTVTILQFGTVGLDTNYMQTHILDAHTIDPNNPMSKYIVAAHLLNAMK